MAESFVFYKSFIECIRMFSKDAQLLLLNDLIDSAIYGKEPEDPAVFMMMQNVKASQERYEKSVENGAKGGRPSFIQPEEWQPYYSEHTQKETAEHFGISVDTLQRWIKATHFKKPQNTAKPQNLTYTDTYTVTDTDTVTSISNNNKSSPSADASEAPPCPAVKLEDGETLVDTKYNGENWVAFIENSDGEVTAYNVSN